MGVWSDLALLERDEEELKVKREDEGFGERTFQYSVLPVRIVDLRFKTENYEEVYRYKNGEVESLLSSDCS